MIAVGSMFRDSSSYIDRSFHQYEGLAKELDKRGETVRFIFCENSSVDDTFDRLRGWAGAWDTTLVQRADDCPYFRSEDRRDRWRHLAWVANGVLEEVTADDDAFIYVESDLAWEPSMMLRLLDHLNTVDVVGPLNMRDDGTLYDRWGTRGMDGRRFTAEPPHHPCLNGADGLVEVQSSAGCTAMVADVARMTRFDPVDCYVGWNRAMRLSGFKVWIDPSLSVVHA